MQCYLCHNNSFELVAETLRYPVDRKAYSCNNCGLVFLFPRMTPEEERFYYEEEYGIVYSIEKGTTPEKLFQSRLPDAKMYLEWVKGYIRPNDDCLELGCASGYFLATIKELVASVSGIETHHLLKNYCKSIGISIYDSIDECQENQFNCVFMFFLLEHIGDPVMYLKNVMRVMKHGGKLFIVVPNVNDALLKLYDIPEFKNFYFTPAHQFYYSKETLALMLKTAGLKAFNIFPLQRYDLSNHMYWMQFRKPGGFGKYNTVFSQSLRDEYAENLKNNFLCDTLLAVVTK